MKKVCLVSSVVYKVRTVRAMKSAVAVCLQLCNRGLHESESAFHRRMLTYSFVIHFLLSQHVVESNPLPGRCLCLAQTLEIRWIWMTGGLREMVACGNTVAVFMGDGVGLYVNTSPSEPPVFLKLHCCDCWTAVVLLM